MTGGPLPDDLLSAYLDGECTPAERAAVEARLAADARWREELEAVRSARDALRRLPFREPPAGFLADLTRGTPGAAAPRPRRAARVAPSRPPAARTALAAVAAVAATIVAVVAAAPDGPGPEGEVRPAIAHLSRTHAATAGLEVEPAHLVAPAAVPAELPR
ncbi:MAG: hypothetical protein KatS3mg009_0047 [Acidimicrobiia bacterium]|nr:MAG: hypothetical protein KatS3mg009_0047 [Acidimicrobiia bacterium]